MLHLQSERNPRTFSFKVSEYPPKLKILKVTFPGSQCSNLTKMKGKYVFLTKILFERNLKLILCAYTFRQTLYLKKIIKICSSLT